MVTLTWILSKKARMGRGNRRTKRPVPNRARVWAKRSWRLSRRQLKQSSHTHLLVTTQRNKSVLNLTLILTNKDTINLFYLHPLSPALVAPESYSDLKDLLHGHTPDNQRIIVARTQKCNHPSLAAGNKLKLQVRHGGGYIFVWISVVSLQTVSGCIQCWMNSQRNLRLF